MTASPSAFAVLDLPRGSIVSFDGCSVALKRDDFIGFSPIPTDRCFHLVTIRAGAVVTDPGNSAGVTQNPSATTVGFAYFTGETTAIVRRFDPATEEVSPVPVDETTVQNLLEQIKNKIINPERMVSYDQFVSQVRSEVWKNLTSFVSNRLLKKRSIQPGEKLIPGSFQDDDENDDTTATISQQRGTAPTKQIIDGKSIDYPSIPVVRSFDGVRYSKHTGTKRFVATLTASQRTQLFTDASPSRKALQLMLERYYANRWEDLLGDIQLSYILFLNLHCFTSLAQWRDLVAALSSIDVEGAAEYSQMYCGLLRVLTNQLGTMDSDLFDDNGYFSDDSFLIDSFRLLLSTLSRIVDSDISSELVRFQKLVLDRFPDRFGEHAEGETNESPLEAMGMDFGDESDEDDPIIVSSEDIEASLARSNTATSSSLPLQHYPDNIRREYSLLFAAKMPNEDVVMTCARVLDEARDVSLVREAAAYLENIEAHS